MRVLVDTNVAVVANQRNTHATTECIRACVNRLALIRTEQILVLDDKRLILDEYKRRLRSEGQPGVGDQFLLWVLSNLANPQRCEVVSITLKDPSRNANDFVEFPDIPELEKFDPADKKFVAVALAHPDHPPILNAVDTDWQIYREPLERVGVMVEFLCGELKPRQ
jgi:hypothetical protein